MCECGRLKLFEPAPIKLDPQIPLGMDATPVSQTAESYVPILVDLNAPKPRKTTKSEQVNRQSLAGKPLF